MPIAAVPNYLGTDFQHASPGMRFGMYLKLWEGSAWSKSKDKPLDGAKRLNDCDKQTMRELLARQKQVFVVAVATEAAFQLDALATAPFTTGLGNEHPLENGFAFLNPYGLPYLPGSGIKGVLRQEARELARGDWGDTQGWDAAAINALFGKESSDGDIDHLRGALSFWDVIPQIAGDSLTVEIMTPHQSHYYQHGQSPHESGQPNPISFLTVPPKSRFVFHVQCDLAYLNRLAPSLVASDCWKVLLDAAFHHAFNWLGFGAKTAVGYGAMQENPAAKAEHEQKEAEGRAEAERLAKEARRQTMTPEELAWEERQPTIEQFRRLFDAARAAPYQPGGQFDNQRMGFMKTALDWQDKRSRNAAAELLRETMTKVWGMPGKKETKQRFQEAIEQLGSQT
ncbi:MAG: type III-B CRISPR module RAMP protein Cmr6 [Gammaproteobacteria bacterium RIFOXYA12_FULL_61_12]|nr:MAG: type III-B CRISPR module RAMP protein Cmr6 [Gammaproteobacteria bacterium RIFOXYA12_FULL_61_12]